MTDTDDIALVRQQMAWHGVEGDAHEFLRQSIKLAKETPMTTYEALQVIIAHAKHATRGMLLATWVDLCAQFGLDETVAAAKARER